MAEEIYIELPEEKYIQAIFSKPADALSHRFNKSLIVCVHDFPGNFDGTENVFLNLQDLFLQHRHALLRFNFRGCGKSDGQAFEFSLQQAKADLQTVIKWAENQGYEHITLITEGLSALFIGMDSLQKSVKNIVFLWPSLNSHDVLQRYFKISDHSEDLENVGFFKFKDTSIGKIFVDDISELDTIKYAKNLKLPTLAFHGKEDKISPISNLNVIREHLGAKRIDITTFDDGTHGLPLPNHRKAIATHTLHFIERFSLK